MQLNLFFRLRGSAAKMKGFGDEIPKRDPKGGSPLRPLI